MYSIIGLPKHFTRETTQHKITTAFLPTEAYEQALSTKTPILYIVGNKGTGKSTILNKILIDNSPNVLLFYFKEKFQKIEGKAKKSLVEKPSVQPYLTYEIEWKNELWNEIVLHLYNKHVKERGLMPIDQGVYSIFYDFIRGRHLSIKLPLPIKVFDVVSRIRKVIFPGGSGGEIGPSDLDYSGSNGIDLVKEDVAKVLIEKPLFLMVDEIDKIDSWNPEVHACIKGLIEAIDSVHREIYPHNQEKYDLLMRIAIRGDMLQAATDQYVDEVKVNGIPIDNWSAPDLEELTAQQLRQHWNIRAYEVSRRKLLTEIFPPMLLKSDKEPYAYFHLLSGGNPRFLFSMLKKSMEVSIQRVKLTANNQIGPVFVTGRDIEAILKKYSDDSLSEQLNGKNFLYPGLERLKAFIKNRKVIFEKEKTITDEDFYKDLFEFIQGDSELLQKIKNWPRLETPIEEKVPKVLYELNLIAYKRGTKLIYYPTVMPQNGTIVIHPWFQYALFDKKLPVKSGNNPLEDFKKARTNLVMSADRVTKLINSTGSTALPANEEMESQSHEAKSFLEGNDILYGIAHFMWSLRNFSKLTLAFSDQLPVGVRESLILFLKTIDDTFEKASSALDTDVKNLHLLAILLNSGIEQTYVEQVIFEKEMVLSENQEVFFESTKNISVWINALKSDQQRENLTMQIDAILASLKLKLAEIILEPVAEVL